MPLTDLILPFGALLFVTGLFFVIATAVNRLKRGGPWVGQRRTVGATEAASRIQVVQSCTLDSHRRLVLVRCGSGSALLLLGGANDLVVLRNDSATPTLPSSLEGIS